ncbi:TIGR01619 family protein [Pasteurella sp. PK-2025]|uniref:TIGR01619 family protein n=1 Tax=unclassified Pasteurella TaxID=2621516 RepID=UPI003C756930
MEIDRSWQTYRSMVNNALAIFSINLDILKKFPSETMHKVVQCALPYQMDENGLPDSQHYQDLMNQVFKILVQVGALPSTLYAGHVFSLGHVQLYFYCQNPQPVLDVLKQFEQIQQTSVQDDPNWDTYFDFLLPSPLEVKINATEEVLDMLRQSGRDLADTFLIEHNFHFEDEDSMYRFMEHMNLQSIDFVAIKYSHSPIMLEEDEPIYMVKIEQELALNTLDIFQHVETFEQIASQLGGEYMGWECDSINQDKGQLN